MERKAWQAIVLGVTKSWTLLSDLAVADRLPHGGINGEDIISP